MKKQYISYVQACAIAETGLWDIEKMEDDDTIYYDCLQKNETSIESYLGNAKEIVSQGIEICLYPRFTFDDAVQWFREVASTHIQMISLERTKWTYDLIDLCEIYKDDDFKEYYDSFAELRSNGFGVFDSYESALSDAIDKATSVFAPVEVEETDSPVLSEEEYNKLCADAENMNVYDGRGTYDLYNCGCGNRIVTTYADKGVTPFIIRCPKCGKDMAHTQTFRYVPDYVKVIKWVRPTYSQYVNLPPYTRQHIEQGGLILENMLNNE